jgi:mRNA interferase RelE/StbE
VAEYRVVLARSAERDLSGLPESTQDRLIRAVDALATTPRPSGVKKLRGTRDLWRIRVGDYRVIYRVDDVKRLVDISHVRHRREAYQ